MSQRRPSSQASSHHPSQASSPKKQQTISSFFSKPAVTPKAPIPLRKTTSNVSKSPLPIECAAGEERDEDRPFDHDDEADESPQRPSLKRVLEHASHDGHESKKVRSSPPAPAATPNVFTCAGDSPTKSSPSERPKATSLDRTSRYLFSDGGHDAAEQDIHDAEADAEYQRQKERLHQKFVKKLGRPDSMAELRRRTQWLENPTAEDEEAAAGEDSEDAAEKETASKRKPLAGGKKKKLTPMEEQFLKIKRQHQDALLVVEVGYKFRFFGEDARVAARELSIVCIPGKMRFDEHPSEAHIDRFASASIPTHRLHVHVKRLVAAGHKVGVVRQLETAALKAAGDNRNAPFVRKLTNLYTKGTYVDDAGSAEGDPNGPAGGAPATGHLLAITESNAKGWGTDEKVHIGIVAVQPATGDVIYDDFEDGFMRSEIETRLLHIAPCELLIIGDMSKATEKLVQHLANSKTNVFGDKTRVERCEKKKTAAATSFEHVKKFYGGKAAQSVLEGSRTTLDKIHQLSEHVTICLSAMITHLTDFGLEHVFDLTSNFQAFSARSHMLLNGTTLTSLEIFRNQTDHTERGSLFWVLDRTQTRFGQRLLRKWVGRPLLDKGKLEQRIAAVEELKDTEQTGAAEKLRNLLLKSKGDLEKTLIRIYYKKCTRPELVSFLQTIQRISTDYAHVKSAADAGFDSAMVNDAIAYLPGVLEDVISYLDKINVDAAKKNDRESFFREEHETDDISEHKLGIANVEQELEELKAEIAAAVKMKRIDYATVAGIDFLVEIDNKDVKKVPGSWQKISGTKKVSRFHTPQVVKLMRSRDQHKESLVAACNQAFQDLLADISTQYQAFRDVIQAMATLDCLLSLADVACRPDYCRPTFTQDTRIDVVGGRHPMVEQLLLDSYVPNDIDLSHDATRALIVTGPNMGGKSSYVRQVALISIMGQIGSYVPAASARLGMLDAVFTRMGAFDNLLAGESTFMVELSETSDILKQATPRSLIILDELGRGTSTHDGVAIAHAVLEHIVRETRSLLLFITHYQSLGAVSAAFAGEVQNVHMRFTESPSDAPAPARPAITFLYELGAGVAHRSYGLNVARLAHVPRRVLDVAAVKSAEMEAGMRQAQRASLMARLRGLLQDGDGRIEEVVAGWDLL